MNNEFRLYEKALLSNKLPHEEPNTKDVKKLIKENKAMLARWTTDFDCKEETEWWYIIKDDKYDISKLTSKYRTKINKGRRNFEVKFINPKEYETQIKEVFDIANAAYSKLSKHKKIDYRLDEEWIWIGAIERTTKKLSACARCKLDHNNGLEVLNLDNVKSLPEMKRKGVNLALIDFVCEYYMNQKEIAYIYNGERAIRHITNFQDYLITYFGFRKAYCKLYIIYSKTMEIAVSMLFPFRRLIKKLRYINRFIYNVSCILHQEEIHRSFKGR